MKRTSKLWISLMAVIILSIVSSYTVYADPNSSKGFAEYDETKAEEENNRLLEEQKKQQEEVVGKSTNNYLENLQVEGYEIFPQFDKQTIDYTISIKEKTDKINIIATPSDEKAKIEGDGEVQLKDNQKECRIDVIAESGTVRTYMIYFGEEAKKEYYNHSEEQEEVVKGSEHENIVANSNISDDSATTSIDKIIFAVLAIIIIILIGIGLIKKKPKKGKHC